MGMPPGMMPAEFPNAPQPSGEPASPFSIKDEGMPNAFSDLVDPRALRPVRWQLDAGYTMLWFRSASYPITATTGSVNDTVPGALGQKNTKTLSGTRDVGVVSAYRTTFTYWLKDPEILAFEASFLYMEQRSSIQDFNSSVTGDPVLTRPYFNIVTRREDADPRAIPGVLRGTMHDSVTTRFMGAEANLRCSSGAFQGSSFNFLGGFRFVRLDDRYNSYDTIIDVAGVGPITSISDAFTAHNSFYGAQVGLDWQYRLERLTLGLTGKIAVGRNFQELQISGETAVTDIPTGAVTSSTPQGLYAQPTNVGTYKVTRTALVPEVGAKMSINLTDHLRLNVGYTFLAMTNTLRAGDQMDRVINIQPLLADAPTAPLSPPPPTFRQSTFTTHMLNVGLEFLF